MTQSALHGTWILELSPVRTLGRQVPRSSERLSRLAASTARPSSVSHKQGGGGRGRGVLSCDDEEVR